MGKARTILACTACGRPASQWAGRCASCGAWGTVEERHEVVGARGRPAVVSLVRGETEARLGTGYAGVDRVVGGGLVPGSVVLVAGPPGIGKSTLLLQVAANVGTGDRPTLYASGEESHGQVAARAARLGVDADRVSFVPGREVGEVVDAAASARPALLVVDSIQSIRDPAQPALAGGTSQVRACTDALVGLAKREGITVVLAGQVTKDGDVAGPRTLEHAVDAVCSFDGDARSGLRVLAGGKNRFGDEGELAWFEMTGKGLREVPPPALAGREAEPGSATALVRAGRGALAVEVQALSAGVEGPPRRNVSGLDARRFGIIAAVLDRALGLRLARTELYGAVPGGIVVDDPGADLAVAAALTSAVTGAAPPPAAAFVGEVTLTGSVRPAAGLASRLRAAAAAGIEIVFSAEVPEGPAAVSVHHVRRIEEALRWARPRPERSSPASSGSRTSRDEETARLANTASDLRF